MTATCEARRSAGVDRRTVGPALLVLALAVLMSVVLPSIDSATSYRDQVDKGDVAALADGLTLVPASGWDLATGALVGHTRSPVGTMSTTEVVDGSVELQVQAAPFDGTPSALLTRVNKIDSDLAPPAGRRRRAVPPLCRQYAAGGRRCRRGLRGRPQAGDDRRVRVPLPRASTSSDGEPAGEGVTVVAAGLTASISRRRDDIVAMIRSIRTAS